MKGQINSKRRLDMNKKKFIITIIIVLILVLIDQTTKIFAIKNLKDTSLDIIHNILSLRYTENTGGAFGVGQNGTMTFIISTIIVLGLIVRFIALQIERIDIKLMIILSFIMAGGVSNLIDRLFRGFVIDFVQIFPNTKFPIFNFADVFIVIGLIILALLFAIHTWKEKRMEDSDIKNIDSKVE